jgi:hypothetical protein
VLSRTALSVVEFIVIAYLLALLIDIVFYVGSPPLTVPEATTRVVLLLWGFVRMWSIVLAVVICLTVHREGIVAWFRGVVRFSRSTLVLYFLSPLLVYVALGLYILIAMSLNLFDFNAYVNLLANAIRNATPTLPEPDVKKLAWTSAVVQIPYAYIAAVTINALFALGEELGWRGYLYKALGFKPSLKNAIAIGAAWGLWHASAIVLLGFNYSYNRVVGVALFTFLCIALTYPHLAVTSAANSVLPAASLHGAVNALWGLTLLTSTLPPQQKELVLGLGLLGIATWSIASALLATVMQWGKHFKRP